MATVNHRQPAGVSHGSPVGAPQFDPWILWVTFRRCWPWAIPTGAVLASVVAFVVLQSFEPRYRATHLLEANDQPILFKGVMPTVTDLARSQKAIIFNRIVLDEILDNPDLCAAPSLTDPETAETNLRDNLSISNAGSKDLLHVSYEDTDRVAAAEICNAVVAAYLHRRADLDSTRINALESWLGPEIIKWENQVEEKKETVRILSKEALGYVPGQRAQVLENNAQVELVSTLHGQITDVEMSLMLMEADRKLRDHQASADSGSVIDEFVEPEITVIRRDPSEVEILAAIDADPAVVEAMARLKVYKDELMSLEINGLKNIRKSYYAEVQIKRDKAIALIDSEKKKVRPQVEERLNHAADLQYQSELKLRDSQIAAAKAAHAREAERLRKNRQIEFDNRMTEDQLAYTAQVEKLAALKKRYETEMSKLRDHAEDSANLQFAREELAVANGILIKLRDRRAAIRTERQKQGMVRTLAPAKPPKTPIEDAPIKKLAVFSGGAFIVPFLLGLLWEFRIQRVTDSKSVEKGTLAPIVGEVARLPAGEGTGKGRRLFEESVDTLRANLFLSVDTANTRSIAVASSMSGEGKSSVASQLALSIAKATGETVLLVDADLRCPDQHEIFGLEMGAGLCAVLSGEADMEDAIDKSLGDLIHVLPAGRLTSSPHRLMSPSAMREFFDNALQEYAFVVCDTAPVLSAGETLAVSSAVDSTLLCVMRDVSRMECISKTTRRLEAAGATIAGTVFSGVTARQYAYRYGDYHYAFAGDPQHHVDG